ncbi:MAG: ROK family protein [Bacteroidetes bacterium]|nr:ROK family protein [Bacteroidota bacterium]
MEKLFGIDLGGTKMEGVVIELGNPIRAIFRERLPTEREKGYDHILQQIKRLKDQMEASAECKAEIIGMGTPGDTDPQTGLLRNSNTLCLNEKPFHADLEKLLDAKIEMANDANCFALAEFHLGAIRRKAPETKVAYGVIMGTGVGGGLVVKGDLWEGKHGIAGEWGHNFLDESGGYCYCGRYGCIESVISGPALEAYYRSLSGGNTIRMPEILKLGDEKEQGAEVKTKERLLHFFGKALGTVVNLIDPDAIVIGGGLGNYDALYTAGRVEVAKNIFNNRFETKLLKPELGDSAGVFGAVLLAANEAQKQQLRDRYQELTSS